MKWSLDRSRRLRIRYATPPTAIPSANSQAAELDEERSDFIMLLGRCEVRSGYILHAYPVDSERPSM